MSLPADTSPAIADALGYLQHHLQELTERQNASEHVINNTLAGLTAQIQQLTQLMTTPALAPTVALPPLTTSPPPVNSSFLVPSAPIKQRTRPKLPSLPDFSGERTSGRAFLNSCILYLHLAPEQFSCDEEKIFWTLAFFKDGHAARWSENLFRQEADTGVFPIQSWADFERHFRSQFFPVNAEADAVNALEGSSYYQGNWTVDDYLDCFLTLVSDTGYTDPWTLVVKFCRGLKTNIQGQIATMPFRRPADTDLEAWYTAARRIDQARLTNEAFQSTLQSTTTAPTCSALPRPAPLSMLCLPQSAPPPVPLRPAPPVPSGGIPMDVDTVQKARPTPPRGCYQCREPNYLVKDCPHCLDVRRLTVEQREELIEDLMALKDTVTEEKVGSSEEEDFV